MIATASKPIRKRRQTRARRCTFKNAYTRFFARVQYGPNLYAGYYAMGLALDPMGESGKWPTWLPRNITADEIREMEKLAEGLRKQELRTARKIVEESQRIAGKAKAPRGHGGRPGQFVPGMLGEQFFIGNHWLVKPVGGTGAKGVIGGAATIATLTTFAAYLTYINFTMRAENHIAQLEFEGDLLSERNRGKYWGNQVGHWANSFFEELRPRLKPFNCNESAVSACGTSFRRQISNQASALAIAVPPLSIKGVFYQLQRFGKLDSSLRQLEECLEKACCLKTGR